MSLKSFFEENGTTCELELNKIAVFQIFGRWISLSKNIFSNVERLEEELQLIVDNVDKLSGTCIELMSKIKEWKEHKIIEDSQKQRNGCRPIKRVHQDHVDARSTSSSVKDNSKCIQTVDLTVDEDMTNNSTAISAAQLAQHVDTDLEAGTTDFHNNELTNENSGAIIVVKSEDGDSDIISIDEEQAGVDNSVWDIDDKKDNGRKVVENDQRKREELVSFLADAISNRSSNSNNNNNINNRKRKCAFTDDIRNSDTSSINDSSTSRSTGNSISNSNSNSNSNSHSHSNSSSNRNYDNDERIICYRDLEGGVLMEDEQASDDLLRGIYDRIYSNNNSSINNVDTSNSNKNSNSNNVVTSNSVPITPPEEGIRRSSRSAVSAAKTAAVPDSSEEQTRNDGLSLCEYASMFLNDLNSGVLSVSQFLKKNEGTQIPTLLGSDDKDVVCVVLDILLHLAEWDKNTYAARWKYICKTKCIEQIIEHILPRDSDVRFNSRKPREMALQFLMLVSTTTINFKFEDCQGVIISPGEAPPKDMTCFNKELLALPLLETLVQNFRLDDSEKCQQFALWTISALTFPHPMVSEAQARTILELSHGVFSSQIELFRNNRKTKYNISFHMCECIEGLMKYYPAVALEPQYCIVDDLCALFNLQTGWVGVERSTLNIISCIAVHDIEVVYQLLYNSENDHNGKDLGNYENSKIVNYMISLLRKENEYKLDYPINEISRIVAYLCNASVIQPANESIKYISSVLLGAKNSLLAVLLERVKNYKGRIKLEAEAELKRVLRECDAKYKHGFIQEKFTAIAMQKFLL